MMKRIRINPQCLRTLGEALWFVALFLLGCFFSKPILAYFHIHCSK